MMSSDTSLRQKKLFSLLGRHRLDGLLVSSTANVRYLSGFTGEESWLLISPKEKYFITDSRYQEQAQRQAKGFRVVLRGRESVYSIFRRLSAKLEVVGFESSSVTHSFFKGLEAALGADRLKSTGGLVEELRIIKDSREIASIRKSTDIAVKSFHYISRAMRPGMTERQAQGRLEYYMKSLGAERPAFDLIIAAGARSSMPHCVTDETRVKNNQMVLVDMGSVCEGYHSDLTRPVFLGKMTAHHKEIRDLVWEAQRAGIRKAGPGVPAKEVDRACRSIIQRRGYGERFGHGTGHGVGLEIHESPSVSSASQTVLKPGMVITVEPGIYLPGRFGVRIEDMVLITEKGNEVLTRDLDQPI